MNNKEILAAFKAIKSKSETTLILERLENVLVYMQSLCKQLNPKGFRPSYIYQWTFKTEIRNKNDHECYLKANIFSATSSLRRTIETIDKGGNSELRSRLMTDFLCDLKPYISYFDKTQDYSWMLINPNIHISNIYFDLANQAFWHGQSSKYIEEKLALSTSTAFFIRQGIEYKIKRILAIDYVLWNDKPYNRTPELCFKVINKCSNLFNLKDFTFEIIKNIYFWTHAFIHGGYRPEPWKTECALDYLKYLYYSGETSKKKSYSKYAGIEVLEKDIVELRKVTESVISEEKNLTIKWISQHEVAVITN